MNATIVQLGSALGLVALLAAPTSAPAMDVMQLLNQVRAASAPGKDMRADFVLDVVNAKGESVQWAGHYYRRSIPDQRIRLVFDSPLDLRGTEVAVVPAPGGASRTRIYLPSVRRVREIQADMRGESFLGTDFNYEDLGLQQLDFQLHSLSDGRDTEGRDCYMLESVPQSGWWYGRVVSCIDKKTSLPIRTEYYDRAGVLWKIRTLQVDKIQSFPTATQITMQTVPTRTLTRITLRNVEYNTGLADVLFESP